MRAAATRTAVVLAVATSALVLAGSAYAGAFPGANGKIAFHSDRDGQFEIYVMDANGANQTRITTNAANDVSPNWSPDGTKIAFVSNRDGNNEIYSVAATGGIATRLTTNAADDVEPSWSGDGTKIAFTTGRDGDFEVYSMDANGASPTRLTTSAGLDSQAAWSADGTKIAFMSTRDGNREIYSMNANGSVPTRLTNSADSDDAPSWSPDGLKIAFAKDNGSTKLACSINAAGGGQICSSFGGLDNPAWSPDNTLVAVDAPPPFTPGGPLEIYTGDPAGNPTAQLTNNAVNDEAPDWQPVITHFARPAGATPLRVPLVPAYKQCTVTNTRHRGTLTTPSCSPPSATSNYLTMATSDFNGVSAVGSGFVRIRAVCAGGAAGELPPCSTTPGDQLDGSITVSQSDVRCQAAGAGCTGALADYTGSLLAELHDVRVTDHNSVGFGSATVQDIQVRFPVTCTPTGSTATGSLCSVNTSIDAVLGGTDVISELKRGLWHVPDVRVYDGGADGVGNTFADNTLFAWTGLFFP